MLFTRCPDCETTFRITADALRKADGQVRCGRCAHVFNAYNELRRRIRRTAGAQRDETAAIARAALANDETAALPRAAPANDEAAALPQIAPKDTSAEPGDSPAAAVQPAPPQSTAPVNENAALLDDISLESVIAELEASAAPDEADAAAREQGDTHAAAAASDTAMSVIMLLAKNGAAATAGAPSGDRTKPSVDGTVPAAPTWVILDEAEPQRITHRMWMYACIGAGALLALQVLHHARHDLATLAGIGPIVQSTYALLGSEVAPDWDLGQYEIVVDWDAAAQPRTDEQRHLRIAAWVRNKGSRELPLPHVQVQLKDRWESTIGSRIFAPAEYLQSSAARNRPIGTGQSALAELDILDPGPQAYGFELDVCVAANTGSLRCAGDEVYR